MTVEIRTIRTEDYPSVMDLHWKHYWRSHCLILNQTFYKWQFVSFLDNHQSYRDESIVAIDENNRLLSYLGLVPIPVTFQRIQLDGAHLITWLTDPEARGQGIGSKIMGHVVEKYDFIFGRSVTPAALSVYQHYGFRYFMNCIRWIAVLDPDATIALAVNHSDLTIKRAKARAVKINQSINYQVNDEAPYGAGKFSTEILSDSLAFMRTNDYFMWRYQQHPFYNYKFLFLGEPEKPEGIAVVRVEQVTGRPGAVLRILEFIATDSQKIKLANAVLAYGIKNRCAYADLFGMSENFVSGFITVGGFNSLEEENLLLPHLLQPWSARIEPPGLLFGGRKNLSEPLEARPTDDMTKIYVSKGDGNMDWPSWVPSSNGKSYAPPTKLAQDKTSKKD